MTTTVPPSHAGPTALALTDLVRGIAADEGAWRPHVRYDATRRWWLRLPSDDAAVDIWLLSWTFEQATELHDHGDAAAAFTVVRGVLTEVRARPDGRLVAERLPSGSTRAVAPGVVHDVRNASPHPAVSIHAYSPPLTRMTFWRAGPGALTRVRVEPADGPERATGPDTTADALAGARA